MSQEVEKIKSEDRKALKTFGFYIICSLVIGVVLGVGLVCISFWGVDVINQFLLKLASVVLPYGIPVVTVVIGIVVGIVYYKSRKVLLVWDGENNEEIDKVETWLSYAVWLTSMNMIWNYFVFGAVFALNCGEGVFESLGDACNMLVVVAAFLVALVINILEQQKMVNLEKEINPEKTGSVYDLKFQKKWEASCDEAELFQIYKSAYKAYKTTQTVCISLWLLCVLGCIIWDFGVMPVLIVSVIWGTMVTSYTMEAIQLSKKGGR